ncbi:CUE domain-containing protein [Mycena indigotica]|uniref:CUE domain-containing protein n=1 Tax=Mycena indigotica TaxID=2126181 RepID=A0A8H6W945_9AGAR|nr:CUE domain-containing protein [Mycena indigotica]KAF7303759.1 CUE domain-containing protein [Mycena indigotica]
MAEIVNVVVAFAVIVFLFRWITKSKSTRRSTLLVLMRGRQRFFVRAQCRRHVGIQAKECYPRNGSSSLYCNVPHFTLQKIDTIHNMFPDIPPENIRYDLLRTGSVELSSNKILERGFLDPPPPAYFTLYPRTPEATRAPQSATSTSSAVRHSAPQPTLIERYNLQSRVKEQESISELDVGGKAVWEDTAAKREASLKERKAQMILAARQFVFPLLAKKKHSPTSSRRMMAAGQQKTAS